MSSEQNTNEDTGGGSRLDVQLDVKDPSICPCGNQYLRCKTQACIDEMCEAEASAYCPHGFLAGCPTCTANTLVKGAPDVERRVMRKCASCGKEKPLDEMKTCMDHRQMHRYVCDSKCMREFYA